MSEEADLDKIVNITGASDDLIEIDGDISEEFGLHDEESGDLIAFSDGTVIRVHYADSGIWRITPVSKGSGELTIEQAPEDDDGHYTDKATIVGAISWVLQGIEIAW